MTRRLFAFLRAINVGGRTVRMETLREHFEELGFEDVATFIASGNVIFETDGPTGRSLEAKIERHLERRLGFDVATFVRSLSEIEAVQRNQPFSADRVKDAHSVHVAFLRDEPAEDAARAVRELDVDTDELALVGRELYWLRRTSVRESQVSGARIEKLIGGPATVRNINTVDRLLAKYGTG